MRIGTGVAKRGAGILLGLASAAAPAVLLPAAARHLSFAREAAVWTEARLPRILIVAALAAGALEAVLSRSPRLRAFPEGGAAPGAGPFPAGVFLPAAATAAFLLPLIRVWSFATSDTGCAFGILPWSDAGNYYRGARELLETGTLDEWNCRRPFNASLLAVRLALAGGSLQGALLLQCVLLGYAAFLFSRAVAEDLGRPAGLLAFAVTLLLGGKYVHWTLSESLGLTLGALAFALLWAGARGTRGVAALAGVFVLTLALNARAGAFLVLPALVAWAGFGRRDGTGFRGRTAGVAVLCIAGAFLLNSSLIRIYGGRWAVGHGNFAFTLYGLASGNPGWTRIYDDFPESRRMGGDEINEFAFERAAESISRDPLRLAKGVAGAYLRFVREFPAGYWRETGTLVGRAAAWGFTAALFAGFVRFLGRPRHRRRSGLVLAFAAGFLASVPFLWVDGESRVYVATLPGFAALAACGIGGWKRENSARDTPGERTTFPSPEGMAAALAAVLTVAAVAGPPVAVRDGNPPVAVAAVSGGSPDSLVIRSDDLHVAILPPGSPEATFVPRVRRVEYLLNLPAFSRKEFRDVSGGGTVFYARIRSPLDGAVPLFRRYVWVLGPPGMADGPGRFLRLQGVHHEEARLFRAESVTDLPAAAR